MCAGVWTYTHAWRCLRRPEEVVRSPGAVVNPLTWGLGSELKSSARAAHFLNQWAISPVPGLFFTFDLLQLDNDTLSEGFTWLYLSRVGFSGFHLSYFCLRYFVFSFFACDSHHTYGIFLSPPIRVYSLCFFVGRFLLLCSQVQSFPT